MTTTPIDLSSLKPGDRILVPATVVSIDCTTSPYKLSFEDGDWYWFARRALAHALPAPPLPIEVGCRVRHEHGAEGEVLAIRRGIVVIDFDKSYLPNISTASADRLTRLPDADEEAGR